VELSTKASHGDEAIGDAGWLARSVRDGHYAGHDFAQQDITTGVKPNHGGYSVSTCSPNEVGEASKRNGC